jgi:integrase
MKPFRQETIRAKHLIPAGAAAGLPFRLGWHTFRHSYRRWLDEASTPLGIIKELLRHARISTTMDVYGVGTLTTAKRNAQTAVVALLRGNSV